jgi:Ca2+-binding EF-hand superfamily protein
MKLNTRQIIYTFLLIICCIPYTNAQGRGGNAPSDRQRPTPPSYEELLQKMDVNKDGKLAKNEAKGPLSKDFKQVDTNGDGFITEDELKKGKPNHKRRKPKNENGVNITSIFKEMDIDKDKKIAKSEAKNIVAERFEEFDLDNDNYISKIEMGKALKKINKDN